MVSGVSGAGGVPPSFSTQQQDVENVPQTASSMQGQLGSFTDQLNAMQQQGPSWLQNGENLQGVANGVQGLHGLAIQITGPKV